VVGGGGSEPTSACRASIRARQRPEVQRRRGDRAQELGGNMEQHSASPAGSKHGGGDAVGPAVGGVHDVRSNRSSQPVQIVAQQ
jgi:hypothetical protein